MWLYGYGAMWLCGYVAMWLSGYVAKLSPYPSTYRLPPLHYIYIYIYIYYMTTIFPVGARLGTCAKIPNNATLKSLMPVCHLQSCLVCLVVCRLAWGLWELPELSLFVAFSL